MWHLCHETLNYQACDLRDGAKRLFKQQQRQQPPRSWSIKVSKDEPQWQRRLTIYYHRLICAWPFLSVFTILYHSFSVYFYLRIHSSHQICRDWFFTPPPTDHRSVDFTAVVWISSVHPGVNRKMRIKYLREISVYFLARNRLNVIFLVGIGYET